MENETFLEWLREAAFVLALLVIFAFCMAVFMVIFEPKLEAKKEKEKVSK